MIKINLLDYRAMKRVMKLQKELVLYLLMVTLVLGVIWYLWDDQNNQVNQMNNEITHWEKELKKINKTVKKVNEAKKIKKRLNHIIKSISVLKFNQKEPARLLDSININLPTDVWLSKFEESAKLVRLEGYAFTDPDIAAFMKNIEKLKHLFTNIELIETRQARLSGMKVRKFKINCGRRAKKAALPKAKKTKKAKKA